MNTLENDFDLHFKDRYRVATPGLRVQAFHRGKKKIDVALGKTHLIYDWASLTKIVFTNTALMNLFDEGTLNPEAPVRRWVSWWPEESTWQIRDLQSHVAGLTWWYPFYRQMVKKTDVRTSPETAWSIFQQMLSRQVRLDFKKKGPASLQRHAVPAVYSDLDYFLLGIINETIHQRSLYQIWSKIAERIGMQSTDFHRGNRAPREHRDSAPTEDSAWRGHVLRGEVHDQNTWSLRGVAPHAGLFGPIDDLSHWGLRLRRSLQGERTRNFPSPEACKLFARRAIPRARGDWALGFMLPAREGASCGPRFSAQSIGHTGFTGTSLWFDPKRDLLITILSNRIHPSVDNIAIRELRPEIHTWIVDHI